MMTPTRADHQHTALLVMDYQSAIVASVAERRPKLIERAAAVLTAARRRPAVVALGSRLPPCAQAGRPIADLARAEQITAPQIAEAPQYRP